MRHAARAPPPPNFAGRRMLQLLALRKVQVTGNGCAACTPFYLSGLVSVIQYFLLSIKFRQKSIRNLPTWRPGVVQKRSQKHVSSRIAKRGVRD